MLGILEAQVRALNLTEKVFLPGHVGNVLDYMLASDYLLHPSLLESSCVVIKEAGLAERPVIVCEGVGDFDAYIESNVNGFLIPTKNFEDEASSLILKTYSDKQSLREIGRNLKTDVLRLFDVNTIIDEYIKLINQK